MNWNGTGGWTATATCIGRRTYPNADAVRAGETPWRWLEVWNNGSVTYTVGLQCSVDDVDVLLYKFEHRLWYEHELTFELSAKPLDVVCTTEGQRVSTSQGSRESHSKHASAVFESAGSTLPSFSGGPWHKETPWVPTCFCGTRGAWMDECGWSFPQVHTRLQGNGWR